MVPILITVLAFATLAFLVIALRLSGAIERAVQEGSPDTPQGYSNIIKSAIAKHVDKDDKPTRKMVFRLRLLVAIIILLFFEILIVALTIV